MTTYEFKTNEDIDTLSRMIVKTEPVPATTKDEEFTLESKINQLSSLKDQKFSIEKQIKDLEAEVLAIKTALSIK